MNHKGTTHTKGRTLCAPFAVFVIFVVHETRFVVQAALARVERYASSAISSGCRVFSSW
jgi:hypothetical protein